MPGRNAFHLLWTVFRRDPLRFLMYVGASGAALVVVYMYLFPPVTSRARQVSVQEPVRKFAETAPVAMAPALANMQQTIRNQEHMRQFMDEMTRAQERLETQLMARDREIQELKQAMMHEQKNGNAALSHQQLQDMVQRTAAAMMQNQTPTPAYNAASTQPPASRIEHAPAMRSIYPEKPPEPVAPPAPPPPPPAMVLPAGSISVGRVSNGVAAKGNEQHLPFVIVLDRDFAGPNDSTVPLRDCHVVAHGSPEAVSARTKFALDTLSCVLPSGETVDTPVAGWVTAADNMNGSWCEVFWNDAQIFKFFGQAAIPTALASLLNQLQDSVTTVSVFGSIQQSGSQTANRLLGRAGDMLLDRAEPFLTPVVWCPQNQPVNIYVEKSVRFEGITPAAWDYPVNAQRSLYD